MPTPSELVEAISHCFDMPIKTVSQIDRNLVTAGLRTTGPRGRNSSVTPLDAARLIIAATGARAFASAIKDSAQTVRTFGELPAWRQTPHLEPGRWTHAMPGLAAGHSFAEALAEILQNISSGRFDKIANVFPELESVEPGVFEIDVVLNIPSNDAEIQISGHTSVPTMKMADERLVYFKMPTQSFTKIRTSGIGVKCSLSKEIFDSIASIFKSSRP